MRGGIFCETSSKSFPHTLCDSGRHRSSGGGGGNRRGESPPPMMTEEANGRTDFVRANDRDRSRSLRTSSGESTLFWAGLFSCPTAAAGSLGLNEGQAAAAGQAGGCLQQQQQQHQRLERSMAYYTACSSLLPPADPPPPAASGGETVGKVGFVYWT